MWTMRDGPIEARETETGAVVSVVRFEKGEEKRYDMCRIEADEMMVFYDPVVDKSGGIDRARFCNMIIMATDKVVNIKKIL